MTDLFPISLDDEIAELERELEIRRRVFPRWVFQGRMTQAKADRQIAVMTSTVERLHRLKGLEK